MEDSQKRGYGPKPRRVTLYTCAKLNATYYRAGPRERKCENQEVRKLFN